MLEFTDTTPMPWGKYKGKALVNVPAVYLLWLYNNNLQHEALKKYIIENLDALSKEATAAKQR
jgi:uncharacterized protein (DUF3820 family)